MGAVGFVRPLETPAKTTIGAPTGVDSGAPGGGGRGEGPTGGGDGGDGLTDQERDLLAAFRSAPPVVRRALLDVVQAAAVAGGGK